MNPVISIIIISYNTAELTEQCIRSVLMDKKFKKDEIPFEIIVVDNDSSDDSVSRIEKIDGVRLIKNRDNVGFGKANNQALKIAKGNYILLLNSDTKVIHGAITQTLDWLSSHPEAGIATAQLLNHDGTIQPSGGFFPNIFNFFTWITGLDDLPLVNKIIKPIHPHSPEFYLKDSFYLKDHCQDWVTGAFLLVRKELILGVNGFDEKYFMYGEELELCYRIKKKYPKYRSWYLVGPQVIHFGGASSSKKTAPIIKELEGMIKFFEIHKPVWQKDFVRLMSRINPSVRIRGWYYKLRGDKQKSDYYMEIISRL